jgi:hypothetical protein
MLVPVNSAWLEMQAGWSSLAGVYARGEIGWHPSPPVSLYGFGQWTPRETMAGAGIRVEF